jgi:hypothetical protein
MEVWKKIKGFEDYYVSNYGNVKSLKNNKIRLLKQENNRGNDKGFYKRVSLCKNNVVTRFQIHRLVAIYFIQNKDNKKCVNHIDGNPSNNHYKNLEWSTHSENEIHSYNVLGKINSQRKLNELQVKDIIENCIKADRKNIYLFPGNVYSFMLKYNVDRKTILNVLNKKYYV